MKISQKGIDLIKSFESCKLTSYKAVETETFYTIGYGHYGADVKKGQTITKDEALKLLDKDLDRFESAVNNLVRVSLNQNQFDALVSLTFNIGVNAFKKSTLLRQLNEKDYEGAKDQFKRWNKSSGIVLNGLIRRRKEEELLFNTKVSEPKVNVKNYKVLYGDNLTKIAKKYKTTVEQLMRLNKEIKNENEIYTNQIIKVPII